MKKIGKFAAEVLSLMSRHPIGLTAGEVFLLYKKRYPNTDRSRNEVAKRISELKVSKLITKKSAVTCCFSGRTATEWGVTAKGDDYAKKFPQLFSVVPVTEPAPMISFPTEPISDLSVAQPHTTTPEPMLRVDFLQRQEHIRLSAYYKFLHRYNNQLPGDEQGDWLEAEREYDEFQLFLQRYLDMGYLAIVGV